MSRMILDHSPWGGQSCPQPPFQAAGPAGKRVRGQDWPPHRGLRSTLIRCVCMLILWVACAAAQGIVSTAPSFTETLFALGAGKRVIGVSQYCNYPPEVERLPRVGTYLNPNIEVIARLHPELGSPPHLEVAVGDVESLDGQHRRRAGRRRHGTYACPR